MTNKNSTGSFIAQFALIAGIYLMLQGIVNMIAVTRNPSRVSAIGVIGSVLFYAFALCLHVTHEGDSTFCIYGGHVFVFIYVIGLLTAIFERIGSWVRG